MTAPSKQLDQFVVRLPDGMRDRIKAAAEANNRSMNAEIIATLEEKYPAPEALDPNDLEVMLDYVLAADSEEAMRARAAEANGVLKSAGKNAAILVLDDTSQRIFKTKAIITNKVMVSGRF